MSPRQEPDALRVEREITVFPAQVQAYTKNHQRPYADAGVRRVCGIYGVQRMRNGINHTVSPLGRAGWEQMRSSWAQTGKATKLCPPAEDLEDLERNWRNDSDVGVAERLSILERKKRAVLTTSAKADTLPTEGFYD